MRRKYWEEDGRVSDNSCSFCTDVGTTRKPISVPVDFEPQMGEMFIDFISTLIRLLLKFIISEKDIKALKKIDKVAY